MPELPEVQTTVSALQARIQGHTITAASVSWERTVTPHTARTFERKIAGTTISAVFRRGKYIGMQLTGRETLFLFTHLRMSGFLDVVPTTRSIARHDRVCLELDAGTSIRFNDTRKFGRMSLCRDPDEIVGHLGVEPLESSFTVNLLSESLLRRKGKIKSVLLDQTIIAGLGNIYVDEVLWKTKVHPLTPAHTLSDKEISLLHTAIRKTLQEAIDKQGTDFGDGVVHGGRYKPRIYGRTGQSCMRCRDTIVRLLVGQRGTHICPSCQKSVRKRPALLRKKRKHK